MRRWVAAASSLALLSAIAFAAPRFRDDSVDVSPVAPIEARTFDVSVARRSLSSKTYLFNDPSEAMPPVGRLLLLKKGDELAMAFRVLKNYPETRQFAAKRVRRYGDYRLLEKDESFIAVERLAELAPAAALAEDASELNELEQSEGIASDAAPEDDPLPTNPEAVPAPTGEAPAPAAADPAAEPPSFEDASAEGEPEGAQREPDASDELSAGDEFAATEPAPEAGPYNEDEETEEPDAHTELMIEEVAPIDENRQWLSAGMGMYFNDNGHGFAGAGMRYALDVGQRVFLSRPQLQDSITFEASLGFYRIVEFWLQSDTEAGDFNLVPFAGTARYNILAGRNFGIFFYAGLVKNFMTSISELTAKANNEAIARLAVAAPAAGAGMFFRFGPNWYVRTDAGNDQIGASLVLRF